MKKSLKELADWVGATVVGDGTIEISGVGAIEEARPGEITFISNPKFLSHLNKTLASAVIVSKEIPQADKPLLCVANPHLAFTKILTLFSQKPYRPGGIDPKAWVSPTAILGKDVTVYPFVFIGDRCSIGDRVTLYPGVSIGKGSVVGEDSILYANVSVYAETVIGKRVILHSSAVIGADGFAYVKDGKKNVKIPQIGIVVIEDDVEIGANSTVDRATLGKTVIRRGVKIDNLVQVAHNVTIGEETILCGQVGVSGSTRVGSNVYLAGQVGLADHITVGDNVMVGAQSGVPGNLPENGIYTGTPPLPHREALRMYNVFPKLPEMRRSLLDIERRMKKIEEAILPEEKQKEK